MKLVVAMWVMLYTDSCLALPTGKSIALTILKPNILGNKTPAGFEDLALILFRDGISSQSFVHLSTDRSLLFSMRALNLDNSTAFSNKELRKLAEMVGSDYIFAPICERVTNGWSLKGNLLGLKAGSVPYEFVQTGTNLAPAIKSLEDNLVHYLSMEEKVSLTTTTNEYASINDDSLAVLCNFVNENVSAKATDLNNDEIVLRGLIKSIPGFSWSYFQLIAVLFREGKSSETLAFATEATKHFPGSAVAHYELGRVMLQINQPVEASNQFKMAIGLDPFHFQSYGQLSRIANSQKRWQDGLEFATNLIAIAPLEAIGHCLAGVASANLGELKNAETHLTSARRYCLNDDFNSLFFLAEGLQCLNAFAEALSCYRKSLPLFSAIHHDQAVKLVEGRISELNQRLIMRSVEADPPRTYSDTELDEFIQKHLSKSDQAMFTNPFQATTELKHWSENLTANLLSETDKAKSIYDALVKGPNLLPNIHSGRTAMEVMRTWKDASVYNTCADLAALYIVLARQAGLKCYYAMVSKDYRGKLVLHACAVVYAEGKAYMVDPAYTWFGVEHKEFRLLSDPEAISAYLVSSANISIAKMGRKLYPDSAYANFRLAILYCGEPDIVLARDSLNAGLRLDGNSWYSLFTQAFVAYFEGHYLQCADQERKSLALYPEYVQGRYVLALAYNKLKKYEEARQEILFGLSGDTDAETNKRLQDCLADIDEQAAKRK